MKSRLLYLTYESCYYYTSIILSFQMGFTQQTFTGKVNRSKVYFGGRHFLGFQYGFKKFPRDSQTIEFKIQIFNADKLEVSFIVFYRSRGREIFDTQCFKQDRAHFLPTVYCHVLFRCLDLTRNCNIFIENRNLL